MPPAADLIFGSLIAMAGGAGLFYFYRSQPRSGYYLREKERKKTFAENSVKRAANHRMAACAALVLVVGMLMLVRGLTRLSM